MIFNELTLPNALRREHSTKPGVWGLVQVIEGDLWLRFDDGRELLLGPGQASIVAPREIHWVDPVGSVQVRLEFFDQPPTLD